LLVKSSWSQHNPNHPDLCLRTPDFETRASGVGGRSISSCLSSFAFPFRYSSRGPRSNKPGPDTPKRIRRIELEWLENICLHHKLQASTHQVEYALGHSSRELDRLSFQGSVLAPFTRQLFTQAGIKPGMRVLDVGSGSGDVSFLAAELVGESGLVLGVDRSLAAVERARARAVGRNPPNVAFAVGDPDAVRSAL
jgi:SAM-dependent methyltransferase